MQSFSIQETNVRANKFKIGIVIKSNYHSKDFRVSSVRKIAVTSYGE